MSNNNSRAVKLCALLLVVSVAVLVFVFKDTDKGPELSEARTDNQDNTQPATKQRPVDRPKDTPATQPEDEVIDLGLSTSEMFEALFKAIEAKDSYAAERLVKALRASKEEGVIPTAKKHFVTTARDQTSNTYMAHMSQYYLLTIFADKDPAYAFENVRHDWGKDGLDPEKAKKWDSFDRRSIDRIAKAMLEGGDRMRTDILASLIISSLNRGDSKYLCVLAWLEKHYLAEMKPEELPDPWLSELVLRMGMYWEQYDEDTIEIIRDFFGWIASTEKFSERLREQVSVLLQADPNSFWELMDILANANSEKAVEKALFGLLSSRAMTDEEQGLFFEASRARFTSDIGPYTQLVNSLGSIDLTDTILTENIRTFAASSVRNALATDSNDLFNSHMALLLATDNAWYRGQTRKGGGELFTTTTGVGIDQIIQLIEKALAANTDGIYIRILVGLVWRTDRSMSDQILDAIHAIELAGTVSVTSINKVFYSSSDNFSTSDGSNVVKLLDLTIENDPKFLNATGTEVRDSRSANLCASRIRCCSNGLAAVGFPPLTKSLKKALTSLVSCFRSDVSNNRLGVLDSGKEKERLEKHVEVLVNKYSLDVR